VSAVDTTTRSPAPRTTARIVTSTGLVCGAVGIVVLKVAGVAMPAVPPGLVLLLVAAALVAALPRHRWPAAVAVLIGLAEVVPSVAGAGVLTGGDVLVVVGTVLRIIGAVTAVVAGIALFRTARRLARAA